MLYLLLSAEFVAAAQVLVYAGAVMVMFLFVIAYLGEPGRRALGGRRRAGRRSARSRRAAALFVEMIVVVGLKTSGRLSHQARDRLRPSGGRARSGGCS